MIFGSLFVTNLFIEVVINTFDHEKKIIDQNFRLTDFQQEWITVQLKCNVTRPTHMRMTKHWVRMLCAEIVDHDYFESFIMIVIILNAIALSTTWPGIPQHVLDISETI